MKSGPILSRRELLLVTCASLVFGCVFSYPIWSHLNEPGVFWDWDFIRGLAWVSATSVTHFHQFPVWNPYVCGGMPMFANPQASILTPFFLLHLLFGPVIGLHLEIPLHLAVGWAGGYFLARVLGLGTLAAITCATLFPASSWYYLHIAVGHHIALSSIYWPWIVAFVLLGIKQRAWRWASIAGLILALVFVEGGPYQASHVGLLLGLALIPIAIANRDPWPIWILGAAVLFAIGFGAVKLLPSYMFIIQHPRPTFQAEHASLHDVWVALFDHNQNVWGEPLGRYAFFEGGAYIGTFFAALVAIGLVARFRSTWNWFLAAAVLLVLSMGDFAEYAPWTLLHMLPVFSSERVTIRLLAPAVLCLSVIAAWGVEFLDRWRPPRGSAIAALLILAGSVDCLSSGPFNLGFIEYFHEQPLEAASPTFEQFGNPETQDITQNQLRFIQGNIGIAHCYEYTGIPTTVVGYNQPDYRGEEYLLGNGSVQPLQWSPNALSYQVETASPNTLIINQNYDDGWVITRGQGRLLSNNGLLAIELPAGAQEVKLVNIGDHLLLGSAITILTAIGALILWRRETSTSLTGQLVFPREYLG